MIGWIIAFAVIGLTSFFIALKYIAKSYRTKLLLQKPLDKKYITIIKQNVPLYNRLPETLKNQLHGLINVFLSEKRFEGCGGLEITDEIKVTITAQACMLLLNRKTDFFPKLKTILVYPRTYVVKQSSFDSGFITEGPSVRLGESWQNGPVVLAWDSIKGSAENIADGRNVIFHEFSHQLDQEDGFADGAPVLPSSSCYASWAKILTAEYRKLQSDEKKGRRSVIDKYGATNPAEFFATATEAFFENSAKLRQKHPELYNEMKEYYKIDPADWPN